MVQKGDPSQKEKKKSEWLSRWNVQFNFSVQRAIYYIKGESRTPRNFQNWFEFETLRFILKSVLIGQPGKSPDNKLRVMIGASFVIVHLGKKKKMMIRVMQQQSICIVDANFNRERRKDSFSSLSSSYLLVNLAKVLMGFDSRNDPFRLNLRLIALFPSESLSKKDWRRFKPLILTSQALNHNWRKTSQRTKFNFPSA